MHGYLKIITLSTSAALCAGFGSAPAAAAATAGQTTSATMAVTLQVVPACSVSTEPLDFGARKAASDSASDATAQIAISCSQATAVRVALDDGQNPVGGARRVVDAATGSYVAYDIFADAAHQRRWGSGAEGSVAVATPAGGAARLVAYGRVAANSAKTPGFYSDIVTVTVEF